MVSRYVNGPVKQEGICLLPPPPSHYRMMPPQPQRADGFHVPAQQQFVQQQQPPNQQGNQQQGLRGMAQTGPPTQASTPPNTDLKVPHVQQQQQQSMNLAFVQPRGNQNFFSRGPPPSQTRMVNTRQGQQQLYSAQAASQLMMSPVTAPMFLNMQFYNGAQRPQTTYVPQNYQIISGGQMAAAYQSYQPQNPQYYFNQFGMQRQAPQPSQVPAVQQNMAHAPPPAVPMTQASQQNTSVKTKSKRRNAIPIIDPETGKEINNDDDFSHPPSGESSARQTPQPAPHPQSKEVQATFAKQVAQVLSGENHEELDTATPLEQQHHHIIEPPHSTYHHPTPQAVHNTSRNDIVQSSKLQVPTKDFVPANQSNTAKETPVVSALTNSVEVTIPGKQGPPKDRESPAKGRKQREPPREPQHARDPPPPQQPPPKEPVKEQPQQQQQSLPPVVHAVEKGIKEERQQQKEVVIVEVAAPPPPVPVTNPPPPKEVVKEKEAPREEKKGLKKDKVDSNKLQQQQPPQQQVHVVAPQEVIAEVVQFPAAAPPAQDSNAKSKQNSQRGKEAPKQGSTTAAAAPQPPPVKPQMPVVVPQSQPAKANNKSNKMKELNMKGATKEGTDMDAFNDNLEAVEQAVVDEPIIMAEYKTVKPEPEPTIKPEVVKPLPKSRIDVCDIVREVPKPFVAPPAPVHVETKDETDRASLSNDKLVQAKNEVNAKSAIDGEENPEFKMSLPYKENQWSPSNKDGKKVYERDFLMALRGFPNSKQKPENILNELLALDDKSRLGDVSRYAITGRTDFTPSFGSFPGKSQSQRGLPTKRGSQQGKIAGGNTKGGKSGSNIRVSISFREDVKLHETQNAWKPARFVPGPTQTDEDKKTEELYRKVRGVLNKLTPQKFNTLISQIKNLPIDTSDRLQGVIELVFEKAVDEPNFSIAYALMCRELALMQVPINAETKEVVNFRKLLITRCQYEFEKNSNEEGNRNDKMKVIEECTDPERKKELMATLDEDDRRIRMKSVGNIRFIGELFKQQMLTVNIMVRCLYNLIENKDEERLECLCKLLTTIGKELETKNVDLSPIFGMMKDIVEKKNTKVSSRVRFMLQDVIDLRNGNWVPRRQDLNPKTIDQIQKEADNEQLNIQAMNSGPMTPRKDDRNQGPNADRKQRGGGGGGGGGNRNVGEDGWQTPAARGKNPAFSVQSDKLKIKHPTVDEPLGSSQAFSNWGRGSNIKTHNPPQTNTGNMFAALEKIADVSEHRSMGGRPNNKELYSSKGPSLERSYKQYEGRGSRSGSQHRSNENSQRSTPTLVQQMPFSKPQQPPPPVEPAGGTTMTAEKLERRMKNIIDEYLNDCCTLEDTNSDIKLSVPQGALEQFVHDGYNGILDRSKTARVKTGKLFTQLIVMQTLSLDSYCTALEKVFSYAEDLIVDIPNIWNYYAELITAPVTESILPLTRLHKCCGMLISQGFAHSLMASIFKIVIEEKGPNFLWGIWQNSKLSFQDFMSPEKVDSFIANNRFEFLIGNGSDATIVQSNLTYTQIHDKLFQFLEANTSFDDITKWITANLGDRMKEQEFIRVLVIVLIESSIVNLKPNLDILRNCYPFFQRYIDNNPDYELQCLYAIQSIVNKLDHPQGLLLSLFNTLYEDNIISHDSFITWQESDDLAGQEKKGVAVKQLTSFFTQLRENDEDSASSGSEEA